MRRDRTYDFAIVGTTLRMNHLASASQGIAEQAQRLVHPALGEGAKAQATGGSKLLLHR